MFRRAPSSQWEINGIAHVHLSVNQFESCKAFYEQLLPFLGMTPVMQTDGVYYCVGGRTGLLITPRSATEPSASSKLELACTICASEPSHAKTSIVCIACW